MYSPWCMQLLARLVNGLQAKQTKNQRGKNVIPYLRKLSQKLTERQTPYCNDHLHEIPFF